MQYSQEYFNGLGACLTNEVLHLARIHPLSPAKEILNSSTRRQRILLAIKDLVATITSEQHEHNIPAAANSSTFLPATGITKYIIQETKVYKKTGSRGVRVSQEHLQALIKDKQIDTTTWSPYKGKGGWVSLPVHAYQVRPNEDSDDTCHVYVSLLRWLIRIKPTDMSPIMQTAISVLPKNAVGEIKHIDTAAATKLAMNAEGNKAEIGVGSFLDTKIKEQEERKAFQRRYTVKTGKVGRPAKRKPVARQKELLGL